jgi:hypothetical protein
LHCKEARCRRYQQRLISTRHRLLPPGGTVKLMPNGQSWRGRSYQVGQGY